MSLRVLIHDTVDYFFNKLEGSAATNEPINPIKPPQLSAEQEERALKWLEKLGISAEDK